MNICLFISGELGYVCLTKLNFRPGLIFTDSKSKEIANWAETNRIPCFCGNPREGRGYHFIKKYQVSLGLSINYLFLLDEDIINYPSDGIINFHGSLLPKYRGRTPHVWAIINGEKETGVTAHMIIKECDKGQIIDQKIVNITNTDTGGSLIEKFKRIYPEFVDDILEKYKTGKLKLRAQKELNASYFGKRTPDDGKINWEKSSKEIYDWVRAQSTPYPGAFTYYKSKKIIIDWIEPIKNNISKRNTPGKILSLHPLIIETGDGSVKIVKYRGEIQNLLKNEILE